MYKIGKIINTHGVQGEVKVKQLTDFVERFYEGNKVYIQNESGDYDRLTIESFRIHKQFILLSFESLQSLSDAEKMKNAYLYIKDNQLTPLEEGEYYYHEIIGCTVKTNDGQYIGEVDHILSPGANDVWVVHNKDGNEFLIPYIEPVVKRVDIDHKTIYIEPMEGLLD